MSTTNASVWALASEVYRNAQNAVDAAERALEDAQCAFEFVSDDDDDDGYTWADWFLDHVCDTQSHDLAETTFATRPAARGKRTRLSKWYARRGERHGHTRRTRG